MRIVFIFLLIQLFLANVMADEITLATDLWCPYACDPNSKTPGFMVEIAKEIFEKKGHKINYKIINWARAIALAKEDEINGVISASRADVVGFILPTIPTGYNSNFFWTIKDSKFIYKDIDSLKGLKVGVINAYSYGDEVDLAVSKKHPSFSTVSGENALLKLIKMTEAKRLEAFVENPFVLKYLLKDLPKYQDSFKAVSKNIANDPDLFIAFSPKNPKSPEYAKIISEGMVQLRKSGKLKDILAKYSLKDWK